VVALDRALMIAKQFGAEVVNTLSVDSPQQVMLEVRFIEVSRNAGRALGVQWNVVSNGVNFSTGPAMAATNATPFGSLLGHILSGGTTADALVQALEDKGLARRLAEPNLVAMSGQTASFLAGGEFPFPIAQNLGQVSVEFKKFGVALNFTPLVLANGMINLKIEPEVSQIDTTTAIQTAVGPVPSLVVRRASTNVELRDGQSFAVAGLMQRMSSDSARQLPWLGNVPVLGALFRSAAFEKNETELAIIVTPHLVQPVKPGQRLNVPTDATVASNDIDRFLYGKQDLTQDEARGGPPARIAQGHILDLAEGGSHDAR
jgi:pilus assembly protein CpaC